MKAIIYTKYGSPDVLHVQEMAKPVPTAKELLVKVMATSVNYGDLLARNFKSISSGEFNMPFLFWLLAKLAFGLRKPRVTVLGSEFSGVVETIGDEVTAFKPGDAVFGYVGQKFGAYAEYVCLPQDGCVKAKPQNMSYEEAAVIPYGSIMALNLLRTAKVQSGQRVLINGASGSIGSAAVQIAKLSGAEVTAVCATPRMEYVKALGADRVIDYTKDDFTKGSGNFDLIFDVLGKSNFSACKKILAEKGCYLLASFKMKQLLQMAWTSLVGSQKLVCAIAPGSPTDLESIRELIEAGKIRTIVDRQFSFDQGAEAHRYAESGQKKGSIAIRVGLPA